jgi:hypothetical protein
VLLRGRIASPRFRQAALLFVPVSLLFAWAMPPDRTRPFGVWKVASMTRMQHAQPRPDPVAEARAAGLTNALVLVRESWHGALAARLRAMGAPPLFAERFIPTVDACVLQNVLDRIPPGASGPHVLEWVLGEVNVPGIPAPAGRPESDRRLSLIPDRPLTPLCAAEMERERVSGVPISWLLPYATFDVDGRLGGDIVWARAHGLRDTLLVDRFPTRRWYRYVIDGRTATGSFQPIGASRQ